MKTRTMVLAMMMMGAMSMNAMAAGTEASHIPFQAPYGEWVCIYSDTKATSLQGASVLIMPDGSILEKDTAIGSWEEGDDGYIVKTDILPDYQISAKLITIEDDTLKEIGFNPEQVSLKYRDADPGAPMLVLETIVTDDTDPMLTINRKGLNYLVRKINQDSFCYKLFENTEWKLNDSVLKFGSKKDSEKTAIELKKGNDTEKGFAYLSGNSEESAYLYMMWENLSPYRYLVTDIEKSSITLTRNDNEDYSIKLLPVENSKKENVE